MPINKAREPRAMRTMDHMGILPELSGVDVILSCVVSKMLFMVDDESV